MSHHRAFCSPSQLGEEAEDELKSWLSNYNK